MPLKSRIRAALAAGVCMLLLNLLVEWLLNRELVRADFLISVVAGALVMLIVFLLLRHLPKKGSKNN
jgi:multisubunit Na+/H+ antiporter MnhB subunit